MKFFKRLTATMVATIMTIGSTALQASAVENEEIAVPAMAEIVDVQECEDGGIVTTYEFEVTPEMAAEGDYGIMPCADVDQTFTMTTSHRGGDRQYSGEYLRYSVTVTDSNGNYADNTISVQLWDYNHSYALTDTRVDADGLTVTRNGIDIVPNRMYYFKYVLTYGSTRTLRVRMQITSYS